jgi:hypothetical protein
MGNQTKLTLSVPVSKEGKYKVTQLNTRTNAIKDIGEIVSVNNEILLKSIDLGGGKDIALLIDIMVE